MRAILATLALVVVAACQAGVSEGQAVPVAASDADPVPVAFAAGPGRRAVNPQLGADVIRSACIGTRPRFKRAPEVMGVMGGFVQDAQSLIYFHQDYDLSVKLFEKRCSVVMGGLRNGQDTLKVRQLAGNENIVFSGTPQKYRGRVYVGFYVEGE